MKIGIISLVLGILASLIYFSWSQSEDRIQRCARKYDRPVDIKYCAMGYTLKDSIDE